jgi:hypothetical protein
VHIDADKLSLAVKQVPGLPDHTQINPHRFNSPWLVDQTFTCGSRMPKTRAIHSCGQAMPIFYDPRYALLDIASIAERRDGIEVEVVYWPDDFLTLPGMNVANAGRLVQTVCLALLSKLLSKKTAPWIGNKRRTTLISASGLPYDIRVCLETVDWHVIFPPGNFTNVVLLETSAIQRPHRTSNERLSTFLSQAIDYDMGQMTMEEAFICIKENYSEARTGFMFHSGMDTFIMARLKVLTTTPYECYRLHLPMSTSASVLRTEVLVTKMSTGLHKVRTFSTMLARIRKFRPATTKAPQTTRQHQPSNDPFPCFSLTALERDVKKRIVPNMDEGTFPFLAYTSQGDVRVAYTKPSKDTAIIKTVTGDCDVYSFLPLRHTCQVSHMVKPAKIRVKTTIRQGCVTKPAAPDDAARSMQVRPTGYHSSRHGLMMSVVMASCVDKDLPTTEVQPVPTSNGWMSRPATKTSKAASQVLHRSLTQVTQMRPQTQHAHGVSFTRLQNLKFKGMSSECTDFPNREVASRVILSTFGLFAYSDTSATAAFEAAGISQWANLATLTNELPGAVARIRRAGVLLYTLPATDDEHQTYTHTYYNASGTEEPEASPENNDYVLNLHHDDQSPKHLSVVIDESFAGEPNTGFLVHPTAFYTLLKKPSKDRKKHYIRPLLYEDVKSDLQALTTAISTPSTVGGASWNRRVRSVAALSP